MTKAETKAALIAAYETARARAAATPSTENRRAAVKASATLSAWVAENDPPKRGGFACKAGQRQAAERDAVRTRRSR